MMQGGEEETKDGSEEGAAGGEPPVPAVNAINLSISLSGVTEAWCITAMLPGGLMLHSAESRWTGLVWRVVLCSPEFLEDRQMAEACKDRRWMSQLGALVMEQDTEKTHLPSFTRTQ
ncbi:hypothetical protein AAFF_G00247220 [Aldrovandia affinis]|uniref:Uncharacterized protein n=1 Tax=Aldrovandia affinis TaxID=143900 RepID=A0AAD7SUA6_9TELE|nr:hypothetical protein AAFF_G00247220 [Aldrovandia affinis]